MTYGMGSLKWHPERKWESTANSPVIDSKVDESGRQGRGREKRKRRRGGGGGGGGGRILHRRIERKRNGNGKWKMENGKWKMENGKWKMENGKQMN